MRRPIIGREPLPAGGLFAEALAASGREFIELGAAIIFRCPTRLKQSLADGAKETRIKCALFDREWVTGDLSDAQQNAVTMQRGERDRPQDEEIEGAGKKVEPRQSPVLLR